MPYHPTRKLTILALDPSVKDGQNILRTQIEISNELLDPGPRGSRVHIVDYDSSNDSLYGPHVIPAGMNHDVKAPIDPFEGQSDKELLASPAFHAFMTYGIVMKTLARFERALGRRIGWSFGSHQIQVAPHAFADANAFYSDKAEGLYFGYFPSADGKRKIFCCLSHEVVVHETTHALLDGLRERYTDASSPQQAGFHEGFADIVALLSILSAPSVVAKVIDLGFGRAGRGPIRRKDVTPERLRDSGLFGLAQEMGQELAAIRGQALRRSIALHPGTDDLTDYLSSDEPHACGEVLVAAVLNAYVNVWTDRLKAIGNARTVDRDRATEEGSEIADSLLTTCIRAIDYCPPTDLQFGDFASALLTADWELNPNDKYGLRACLLDSFIAYGINPRSTGTPEQPGAWQPPPDNAVFQYDRTHFDSMKFDPEELCRFLWENRRHFKLHEQAYTRVLSVRPCIRTGRDGFTLRETVAEYVQQLTITARELRGMGIAKPIGMPDETEVTLYGGNAVIFDEYGHVKYSIGNSIMDLKRQSARLNSLWLRGSYDEGAGKMLAFSRMHLRGCTEWYRALTQNAAGEQE
jgi:hypothetical protein